jgi:F0F1-type ATP synthase membrane subunit c/vacuolar-type H+-ATPase subunit K
LSCSPSAYSLWLAQCLPKAPAEAIPFDANRRAAAYIAMGIASGLCGLGQGRATASGAEAMARNPAAVAAIRVALILGLVLIESLALYTLVITFIAQ